MKQFAHALIVLVVPVILVLTWLRVLLTPVFVRSEYNKSAFPPDPYGFSLEDRLHWSEISRQYLLNREGIQFLGDQHLPDGTPLYNVRELRHMADVKKVVSGALLTWAVALLVGGLASAYLVRRSADPSLHADRVGQRAHGSAAGRHPWLASRWRGIGSSWSSTGYSSRATRGCSSTLIC